MNKRILYAAVAVVLVAALGFGGWYVLNQNTASDQSTQQQATDTPTTTQQATESANTAKEVSYKGEEGKTALQLLQENAEVETSGEGEMAFVTTINGYKAQDNEFWAFYVNGEQAQVGAGSYQTKPTDEITWKIETF